MSLAEVVGHVVQLPLILVEIVTADVLPRQAAMARGRDPAVAVDRPVAEHLEILRVASLLGACIVEAIQHADALDRLLGDAVDDGRLLDCCCLQYCRHDVDDILELLTNTALVLDPLWPGDHQWVAGAAKVRGDLLAPLEWRVHRPGP